MLSPAAQRMARLLLEWDGRRIRMAQARGLDCSVYLARLAAAEQSIGADPATWTVDTRCIYMTVIETVATGERTPMAIAIGRAGVERFGDLTPEQLAACREIATAAGVAGPLREVVPGLWREA